MRSTFVLMVILIDLGLYEWMNMWVQDDKQSYCEYQMIKPSVTMYKRIHSQYSSVVNIL